jgi:glycosyltransferase involved in cell wall biosynthesis
MSGPNDLQPKATSQRVVLLGSYAPSLIIFRGSLIRAMVERGHHVTAVAPAIDDETAAQVRALGAEPVSIALGNTSLNPLSFLRSLREIRAVLAKARPDVLVAYTIKPIVLGGMAAKAEGIARFVPLITGMGYAFTPGRELKRLLSSAFAALLYRRALRGAHVAVFQNTDDRAEFKRRGLLPVALPTPIINGSGVDLDHFGEAPLSGEPSFLMIARLLRDKGVREFGEAARRLKERYPAIRIGLVGWLHPSPDAISPAEMAALEEAGVEFHGKLDDVRPAIADYSVYVLPSYREGTPRSVLEAMAMGRPIITTDAPGCRETVVEGVNGFMVPVRDSGALYEAMLRFVENPDLIAPMGAESRRIAEEKYDVHQVNREFLAHAGL